MLSNAHYSTLLLILFLDFEEANNDVNDQNIEGKEFYYEAPDLSGGIEGVDYIIAYGADDNEEEEPYE